MWHNVSRFRSKLEDYQYKEMMEYRQNQYFRLIEELEISASKKKQAKLDLILLLSDPDSAPRLKRILNCLTRFQTDD